MKRTDARRTLAWTMLAVLAVAGALAACTSKTPAAATTAAPADQGAAEAPPVADAAPPPGAVDPNAEPAVETLTLAAGFGAEPRTLTVPVGGDIDANSINPECSGRVGRNPDVRVRYTAGASSLNFYVTSDLDTTLVVRRPDGGWLCNDDYLDSDPAVLMASPLSGNYEIWIGSYDGSPGEALLHVSEKAPEIHIPSKGDLDRTPDVVFVPTPQAAVEKMLEMAEIKKGNVLYDLGCGDGRIVVTAARKYGIRAVGFDIDPKRVEESIANVKKAKVGHLVTIKHADIFTVDLSEADVVTLYLLPRLNVALMPQLRKLKPGSRIVSFDFDMKGAKPVEVLNKEFGDSGTRTIYKWVVPWEDE